MVYHKIIFADSDLLLNVKCSSIMPTMVESPAFTYHMMESKFAVFSPEIGLAVAQSTYSSCHYHCLQARCLYAVVWSILTFGSNWSSLWGCCIAADLDVGMKFTHHQTNGKSRYCLYRVKLTINQHWEDSVYEYHMIETNLDNKCWVLFGTISNNFSYYSHFCNVFLVSVVWCYLHETISKYFILFF